jgi:hypothetical protein
VLPLSEARIVAPDTTGLPPRIRRGLLHGLGLDDMAEAIYGKDTGDDESDDDDERDAEADALAERTNRFD